MRVCYRDSSKWLFLGVDWNAIPDICESKRFWSLAVAKVSLRNSCLGGFVKSSGGPPGFDVQRKYNQSAKVTVMECSCGRSPVCV